MALDILEYLHENSNMSHCDEYSSYRDQHGLYLLSKEHPDELFLENLKVIPLEARLGFKQFNIQEPYYVLPIKDLDVSIIEDPNGIDSNSLAVSQSNLDKSIRIHSLDLEDTTHLMLIAEPKGAPSQVVTLPISKVIVLSDPHIYNDVNPELLQGSISEIRSILDPYDGINLEVLSKGCEAKVYYRKTDSEAYYAIAVSYAKMPAPTPIYKTYIHSLKLIVKAEVDWETM